MNEDPEINSAARNSPAVNASESSATSLQRELPLDVRLVANQRRDAAR